MYRFFRASGGWLFVSLLTASLWAMPGFANHSERSTTTIRAASELDYPPFSVVGPEGQADGFAVELMREALAAMGHDVTFNVGPWHAIKDDLAAGRIQALPLVGRTAARDAYFDFSVPYLSMHGIVVVRKGDPRIRGTDDLKDKSVLVMRGDIAEEYARNHRLSRQLVPTQTVPEALQRLAAGEHDAAVMQKLVAIKLIAELGLDDLVLLDPPLDDFQTFAFAVRDGDSELLALLNEGLALVVADGTYERLRRKWLVPLEGGPAFPILPIVLAVVLALAAAWVVAYLWQRSLRRMVRVRTAELSAANARLAEGQALRESEERLRLAAQAAHFGTFDYHPATRVLQVSDELKAIAGLPCDAAIAFADDGLPAFVHPVDRQRVAQTLAGARRPDGSHQFEDEHRILRPDGTVRWVHLAGKVLFNGEGAVQRPVRMVGTLVDVTERREAEAKFRGLVEQALVGIYIVEGGWFRYVNPAFAAIFGYPSPEALVDNVAIGDLVAPEDRKRVRDNIRLRTDGIVEEMHYDFLGLKRDGSTISVEVHGRSFDYQGRSAVIGVAQDVTRRKRAEEALRESEADLRRAQMVGRIGSWRLDVRRNELYWSEENYRIFGAEPGSPQSYDSFLAAVHPEDRAYVDARWQAALRGEPYDIEHRLLVDGEVRWVREKAELDVDADGQLLGGFGTTQEITERKRAEQALQESEATLRTLFANLPGVAYRCEVQAPWRVVLISEAVREMTGFAAEDFAGDDALVWADLIHPEDLAEVEQAVSEGVSNRRRHTIEYRIVHADGSVRWVFEQGQAIYDDEGEPRCLDGVIVDVTERKRAEEALERKTQELQRINAELEEFAYVASHDLKAPLRAVANLALVIDEDAAPSLAEENRRRLQLLRERVITMDRLIDDLLEYARLGRAPRERRPVALESLVREVVDSLHLPPSFRIVLDGPLPVLSGDPLELRQIFQNLLANAVNHHDRDEGLVRVLARPQGRYWVLEVADDGPGIPPSEREQVFRMFTSRGKRGRSGLGLAIVRKLVFANGGRIEVTENTPRGALFRITWPC